ncbi:Heat shock factor protein [Taphrina deformans PYCC 5710]|uniref:Heat shock factor protein n=1 Tax=Taphrina deformans (strain PYCC 5710 / ATCC 11124 / CBS 356.35 / IMI 108563 / JCM 9778 / NBRC 8474) TaxID=1097556 RepID=R4XB54_TAPDE|nr:Heat shock factor protein [Taphrina deformans PYCC 5710]|eukprot:CCG80538.1 Heat shock factor protein [Taphrina deformans PYCC 5710]
MSTEVALPNSHIASTANASKNVPAFLLKLFTMVNDHSTDDLIRWNAPGDSFLVMRHEDFAKDLLPRYYKHNNFSSFVRQLNMYGFHKIPHIEDNASSKTESQIWEFSNPNFLREQPDMLCLVTRKKSGEAGDKDSLDYQAIMGEIQAIKRHQMTISQDLKRIQADNQALWQEQIDTRTRHSKHQETIEKILNFLGTVYGGQYNEEKSIRPKKRKLLLQHESSDAYATPERIFDDDKTKESFEDMFRSASTSPKLRPLKQPATTTASGQPNSRNSQPQIENRFTLPNFANRQQVASGPAQSQQIRNMNKMKTSPAPVNSPIASTAGASSPAVPNIVPSEDLTGAGSVPGAADTSQALSSMALSDPMSMQLTSSMQNRITNNNSRAHEIEQDLALQDQNIEALASLLGLDPSDLDSSTLDPTLLNDIQYNDFDDYLNTNQYATTPQGSVNPDLSLDSALDAYTNTNNDRLNMTKHDMNPPRRVPNADTPPNGTTNGVHNGARTVSAGTTPSPNDSAPGSTTGSLVDEEIEEIDMDKARGKKRKSTG